MDSLQKIREIINEFNQLENWEEKYQKLIMMGKSLPPMPDTSKTEANQVIGCQSQVWLTAQLSPDNNIIFVADSDALIVKGLLSLLLLFYSQQSISFILEQEPFFLKEMGLQEHLSLTRKNGLASILKQIKLFALALHRLQS